jgi:thiamine-phosphate diphosphorylase
LAAPLPAPPFLYPIIELSRAGAGGVVAAVARVAAAGARIVQLRVKEGSDGAFLGLAQEAVAAAHAHGAALVVNDRADLALLAGADGVHVGQTDLSPKDVRRVVGAGALVGLSTHTLEQARAACREEIDYLAVGPVFATGSKAHAAPLVGTDLVRKVRPLTALPLVAIGGITVERAADVVRAGADGLAVISGLWATGDPGEGVRRFLEVLGPPRAGQRVRLT